MLVGSKHNVKQKHRRRNFTNGIFRHRRISRRIRKGIKMRTTSPLIYKVISIAKWKIYVGRLKT
jgi:hypothetical protein